MSSFFEFVISDFSSMRGVKLGIFVSIGELVRYLLRNEGVN